MNETCNNLARYMYHSNLKSVYCSAWYLYQVLYTGIFCKQCMNDRMHWKIMKMINESVMNNTKVCHMVLGHLKHKGNFVVMKHANICVDCACGLVGTRKPRDERLWLWCWKRECVSKTTYRVCIENSIIFGKRFPALHIYISPGAITQWLASFAPKIWTWVRSPMMPC